MTVSTRKNKATHTGHCQCCGHSQKLPGGVLAKHGYNVFWGFFSGTCSGSGYLPFEVSKDLIEKFIVNAEDRAASLRAQADRERTEADPTSCWYHVYYAASWDRTAKKGYFWEKVSLTQERGFLGYVHPGTNKAERISAGLGAYDLETKAYDLAKVATECNNDHANYLEKTAKQVDQYVAWQRDRIKNWKPQPLVEIK